MSTRSGTPSGDLSTVLFGSTRRRVLSLLYGHPEQRFYLRQIVRESGAAVGAVQRELDLLVRGGILQRTSEGRQVYFAANRNSPVFQELHAIVLKTAGLVEVIRGALLPLTTRIDVAFVFGSAARNELRNDSDVDVLVVGEASFGEVANALVRAQELIGRDVNPTVYPPAEFRAKLTAGHHFLTAVLQQPRLFVVGGPDELDGLGKERLGPETPDNPERGTGPARSRRPRPRRRHS